MKKTTTNAEKGKIKKAFLFSLVLLWGVFCAVFFTLSDFPGDELSRTRPLTQEIFLRLSIALGFGFVFAILVTFVYYKRKTIEWGFVVIWTSAYVGCCVLIVWLFAGRDFSNILFLDLVYSLLLAFPGTIIVVESLEAIL